MIKKSSFYLECNGLKKKFTHNGETVFVLKDIIIQFYAGKTYALTGASGVGKSTLMHILAGIETQTSGALFYNGVTLSNMSAQEIAKIIGIVFQYPHLIKELTVVENVALAALILGVEKTKAKQEALLLLKAVGLEQAANWAVGQLSGGQKQRVALARALINKPQFLLADELTGNLDHTTGLAIMNLVLQLQKQWGMGIIISSHNQEIVSLMEQVFELQGGKLIEKVIMKGRVNECSKQAVHS